MTSEAFPVSFAQQRLWFFDQLEPGTPAYNLPRAIRIAGPLNTRALAQTLQTIVDRHESLRTTFVSEEGEPRQIVEPELTVELPITDLEGTPEPERLEEALRITRADATRGFDLSTGPLVRFRLIRLEAKVHVLVMVMHHIITDGWSISILFREIGDIYRSIIDRRPIELPDLSIQYSDFAQWQRDSFTQDVLGRQLAYWKQKLPESPRLLELPTDRPRPPMATHHGSSKRFLIDEGLAQELNNLSQRERATLFMTLLTAFQVLLMRYTGADDIMVGTPVAGRSEIELEHLIGLFVNTIVVRGDLSGNPSFRTLLQRTRTTTLEAYEYQDTPFDKIVEALEPERSMSYTPLFQVMFVLQNAPKQVIELSHLSLEELDFNSGLAKFDLTLEVIEADGFLCTLEYSTDLFNSSTIDRMARHFENLLRSIVLNPDIPVADLEMIDRDEVERVLVEWNDTKRPYRRDATIHLLFEEQANCTPNHVALIDHDGCKVTFDELNKRSNVIAHYLLSKRLQPDAPVGVCMERSIDMVAGVLGVLKSGHPYLPLDPSYPQERLAYMLADSGAPLVLSHRGLKASLSEALGAGAVDLDSITTNSLGASDPHVPMSSDALAYVMYTSGSTGHPKGVEGTHRAAINRFEWMWREYAFQSGEICCQKTALNFVDSVWETFGPLLQGVSIVIIPEEIVLEPEQLVERLSEQKVTRIVLVPSLLRVLLEDVSELGSRLSAVKLWISSGEALPLELAKRFREEFPRATLLNLYGSSEIAGDVTSFEVKSVDELSSVPIGKPISNVQIFILDRNMKPVPIGVSGEIYAAGDCLARGYHQRPQLTAERFLINPFSSDESERFYRTGDLGRFLADGNVEYLGRADSQIKLRGIRIEPGEIESILTAHPLVHEAVVIVPGKRLEAQQLVAYVVGVDGQPPSTAELRRFLKSRVPDYLIPSSFIPVARLPLLPNGKIDRKALPSPDLNQVAEERVFIAPRNETEEKIASIWRELLHLERVGIDHNFFEIGGHSLLAIQVLSRIRRLLEVDIPVRLLFNDPTITALAVEIEKAKAAGAVVRAPILPRRPLVNGRQALAARLEKLSADEVNALLETLLEGK
jgi:amino acid adenylation domain-containing protein